VNAATVAPAVKPRRSELSRRIAAGLPLAVAAIGIGYAGGLWFFSAILLVTAIIMLEFTALVAARAGRHGSIRAFGMLSIVCVAGAHILLAPPVAWFLVAAFSLVGAIVAGPHMRDRWLFALGVGVAGLFLLALVWLRGDTPLGRANLFWLFAVVWATDIGAYGFGRALGGAKLMPRVSPNKTWSGAIGGLILAVGGSVLLGWLLKTADWVSAMPDLGLLIGVGALISVVSQGGDLAESMLKRAVGKKDSGSLIPGHGGVLDRLDGFIPAAIVLALLLAAAGKLPWMTAG